MYNVERLQINKVSQAFELLNAVERQVEDLQVNQRVQAFDFGDLNTFLINQSAHKKQNLIVIKIKLDKCSQRMQVFDLL